MERIIYLKDRIGVADVALNFGFVKEALKTYEVLPALQPKG